MGPSSHRKSSGGRREAGQGPRDVHRPSFISSTNDRRAKGFIRSLSSDGKVLDVTRFAGLKFAGQTGRSSLVCTEGEAYRNSVVGWSYRLVVWKVFCCEVCCDRG